jgi:dolichyl-diphosphooligosaccharide--protein glycosyltransferase
MASPNSADPKPDSVVEAKSIGEEAWGRLGLPLGLFAVALALRLSPWQRVFHSDGISPYSTDAYYHLRRIQYAIDHFPGFLSFDPFINFPHGAQPIWPPTFDWLVALVLRVLVGPGDPDAMERCAMWVPAVLGAVTVVLVYFLGRRFFSRGVGVLSAIFLSLLPAHFWYSQLGFVDHHVAVALLSVCLLWAGMRLSGQTPESEGFDWEGTRSAAPLGLAMGLALLVWPGSLIHIAVAQVALVARMLTAPNRSQAVVWARRFAFVHLLALVIVAPMSAGNEWQRWGSFSPIVLSNFQPVYLATAASTFWLCSEVWKRWSLCQERLVRLGVAALLGASLVGLLFSLIPELRVGGVDAWAWFTRDEKFQAVVAESTPLFFSSSGVNWIGPQVNLSAFVYLAPLALVWVGWRHWGSGQADRWFFLWWCAALFVATLNQRRFMNSYAIPHALLMAYSILALYGVVGRRIGSLRSRISPESEPASEPGASWGLRLLATALVLAMLSPTFSPYKFHFENLARALKGQAPHSSKMRRSFRLVEDAARWLSENSPPLRGPGYSVLGPWGDGHIIKYLADRPVVQDNFGDDVAKENFELAERYFAAMSEDEALKHIFDARVRYVELRLVGSGHGSGYAPGSLFHRLFMLNGSLGQIEDKSTGERKQVSALRSHRLIYESAPRSRNKANAKPYCRLFEVVSGARVVGQARGGSVVRARLELESRHSGRFEYKAASRADAEGHYALRLPYSNDGFPSEIQVASSYRLTVDGQVKRLVVSEVAVREGLEVRGPDF